MLTHTKRVLKELLKDKRGAEGAPPTAPPRTASPPPAQPPPASAPENSPAKPGAQPDSAAPSSSEKSAEEMLEEYKRREAEANKEAESRLQQNNAEEEARHKEMLEVAKQNAEAGKKQAYSPGAGSTRIAANQVGGGAGDKPPVISALLALASVVSGAWVIKTGGTEAVGAALAFGLLAAAIILMVIAKGKTGWMSTFLWILIVILILATVYYGLSRSLPYIQNKMSIKDVVTDTQTASSKGISKAYNDLRANWQKNIDLASGNRVEGEVDPTAQAEPTGISILPPYFPNVKTIRKNEMNSLEVRARVKGFAPKEKMKVNVVCSLQTQEQATNLSKLSSITGFDLYPGLKQAVNPESFEGDLGFERDISCRPKPDDCGKYVVTITAESDNLRTDSKLYNYVISNSVLRQKLEDYAKYKGQVLENTAQMEAALKNEIFKGQIGDASAKSKSDKGAIMTIIETSKLPLIGLDENTDMTMRVGVENTMAGRLLSINKLEVTIPEFLDIKTPAADNCPEWIQTGSVLTLPPEYFQKINLLEMVKPNQRVFPGCHLIPKYNYDITEPTQATFLAMVDYNYVVQEKYDIDIKNETGGACAKKTSASTQTGYTPQEQTQIQTAVNACTGKAAGDSCSTNMYCAVRQGVGMMCLSICDYTAQRSMSGLNPAYGCYNSPTYCRDGTIKDLSCADTFLPGYNTCCMGK
jgi:hypothetical protein